MAKRRTAKGKKPTQQDLPGTVPKKIKKLHDAALNYVQARDERMACTEAEVAAKEELRAQMHKHQLTSYSHNGVIVTLIPGEEAVRVRVKRDAEDTEGDLGDDTEA